MTREGESTVIPVNARESRRLSERFHGESSLELDIILASQQIRLLDDCYHSLVENNQLDS